MTAHNKLSYKEVKRFVEENSNCKLLSKKYENAIAKMVFVCECGELFKTSFSKFKSRSKRQCNDCSGLGRTTIDDVDKICQSYHLKLLTRRYKNSKQRLPLETKEGYKFMMSYEVMKKGIKKKPIFNRFNPFTSENIKRYIEINNLECEFVGEYKSNKDKLSFKCKCGSVFRTSFNDFRSNHKTHCNTCGIAKRSGENHYDYNPKLTEEERIRRRMLTPNENMRLFRTKVFENDNYTCVICGNKSSKGKSVVLNAHHLNGYHWYEEGRFDPKNGVTMCSCCHNDFHSIYGRKNNTQEQFDEFKSNINLKHA